MCRKREGLFDDLCLCGVVSAMNATTRRRVVDQVCVTKQVRAVHVTIHLRMANTVAQSNQHNSSVAAYAHQNLFLHCHQAYCCVWLVIAQLLHLLEEASATVVPQNQIIHTIQTKSF